MLIARVSDRSLAEFLTERLFEPLGMADTGFEVPAGKLDRFTSYYRTDHAGGLELVDAPDGQWSSLPARGERVKPGIRTGMSGPWRRR